MQDDPEGFIPGPLDTLAPSLRQKAERFPALPVHPRVVMARPSPRERTLVIASFAPAAGARALHAALKPLIEAALLSELSQPAAREDEAPLLAIELYAFVPQPFDPLPALAPFGLAEATLDEPGASAALALLRREAQRIEGAPPDEPVARYRARLVASPHPLAGKLARLLRERAPEAPWGEQPGVLARAAADQLDALGHAGVAPTRAGIERLEEVVAHRTPGVIRWIEPLAFQALCDLVAVTAVSAGLSVEWGVCEPDPDSGLSPPPLIRVAREGESFHVPLGEHVLRWCVMPSAEGEAIPSLGAWAEHEFN